MDLKYMDLAFKYANDALLNDEVPVGAVIVKNGDVLSYGFNSKECSNLVFHHAEIKAIEMAEKIVGNWRLDDCEMYVTLDPCPMCASAIKQARIKNVYSALSNSDIANGELIEKIFMSDKVNPSVNFVSNLFPERSKELLNIFFSKQRNK